MVVYLVHNTVNGKYYVGKTIGSLKQRWAVHKSYAKRGSTSYLHRAMRKYGAENFVISPLMSTLTTDADLLHWEKELIALFMANDPAHGYNLTQGGEGASGVRHSQESRHRRSQMMKGNKRSVGKTAWNKGVSHSSDVIERIREHSKALWQDPNYRAKNATSTGMRWAKPKPVASCAYCSTQFIQRRASHLCCSISCSQKAFPRGARNCCITPSKATE